jgi:hypothetical protein
MELSGKIGQSSWFGRGKCARMDVAPSGRDLDSGAATPHPAGIFAAVGDGGALHSKKPRKYT